MKNLFVILLLIGLFFVNSDSIQFVSAGEEADAKCAFPNFERAFKNAKAVFIGEVIGVEADGGKKTFEFKVKRFWKGIEEKKIKVYVYENRRYQSPYKVGETFLVYAKDDEEGGLWDGRCSRSRNVDGFAPALKEDLKSLGEGKTCISLSEEKKILSRERENK